MKRGHVSPDQIETASRVEAIRRTMEGLIGTPATEGNRVDVLHNGDEIFPAMLEAIGAAQRSIDLLTFVYWTGGVAVRFAHALAERAEHGVRVRVLLDAVGSRQIDDELVAAMTDAGCDLRWFRPVEKGELGSTNHRTHRKVLVCDEVVAFTGGVGIADEWAGDARDENEWRDTHFRIRGPAVSGVRGSFISNWAETADELFDQGFDHFPAMDQPGATTIQVVQGAAEVGWSDISTMFRTLTQLAEERIRFTTAYFNPDDRLLDLLCEASEGGVDVAILLPGPHADKRFVQVAGEASYSALHEAGVDIWTFQPSMLHAKIMTIDGLVASVGSANVNNRSTQFDEEVNLVLFDPVLTSLLDVRFDRDLLRAERIDPDQWAERGLVQRLAEGVMGTVEDLI